MKFNVIICSGAIAFAACLSAFSNTPELGIVSSGTNNVILSISNLIPGGSYYIEHTENLASNSWKKVQQFKGMSGGTNWTSSTGTKGFYRVVREDDHPKIGKIATLDVPGHHDVSGTAHIIDNQTIELRNFNYDGKGIVVEIWVSPNPSFSPYTAISEDLFGTVFSDATLRLDLPEGTDLDQLNYISVWCVAAGVSFGDGMFQ